MKISPQFRQAFPQILAVSAKNVLLLGYGMTLGFPTIVIPAIQGGEGRTEGAGIELSQDQISWFSSINLICVPLGACISGLVTQPIGRRRAMQVLNIPFIAAWLLFHFAKDVEQLYVSLCLCGLAGGLLEAPVLTYVAEITQPHLRGMLSASSSMCIIIGVFTQFLLGTFLDWRTVALINISFPIFAVISLFFVPESPHWLITKDRLEDAKKSLMWLRGWVTFEEIQQEYDELYSQIKKSEATEDKKTCSKIAGNYVKRNFLLPYFLVSFSFFVGHFSGMTTLQTFAVQIFHTLKAPIDKYYATMILGIAQLIGTLLCIILIHYTGKRPLTFVSMMGCGLCFFAVATYAFFLDEVPGDSGNNIVANVTRLAENSTNFYLPNNLTDVPTNNLTTDEFTTQIDYTTTEIYEDYDENSTTKIFNNISEFAYLVTSVDSRNATDVTTKLKVDSRYEWIPMTFLIASALLSHMGIRLIPWMLIGEVYPIETRGVASGLSGGLGYVFGFTANKLFLNMISTFTLPGTFWFYSGVSVLGTIILYFFLPETEGVSLKTIEMHFTGDINLLSKKKVRDIDRSKNSVIRNRKESEMKNIDVSNVSKSRYYKENNKQIDDNGSRVEISRL